MRLSGRGVSSVLVAYPCKSPCRANFDMTDRDSARMFEQRQPHLQPRIRRLLTPTRRATGLLHGNCACQVVREIRVPGGGGSSRTCAPSDWLALATTRSLQSRTGGTRILERVWSTYPCCVMSCVVLSFFHAALPPPPPSSQKTRQLFDGVKERVT